MQLDKVRAYIKNVNFRRQRAGQEQGAIACDVDFECHVDGPMFLCEVSVEEPPKGWGQTLWGKDGKPRELCLGEMKVQREWAGLLVTFESDQPDLFDQDDGTLTGLYAGLKKIVVEAGINSTLKLKAQLQMEPPPEVWDHLPALIQETIMLTLEQEPGDGEGGDDGASGQQEMEPTGTAA